MHPHEYAFWLGISKTLSRLLRLVVWVVSSPSVKETRLIDETIDRAINARARTMRTSENTDEHDCFAILEENVVGVSRAFFP